MHQILRQEESQQPYNSAAVSRLIRYTKLQIAQENDSTVRENLLTSLIDRLVRLVQFGSSQEKDYQLVERSFKQWQEANQLNVRAGIRHLGSDKQNLARVLDGRDCTPV